MRKWQEYLHNPKNTFKGKKYMFMCVNCLYIPYVKHTHTYMSMHTDTEIISFIILRIIFTEN